MRAADDPSWQQYPTTVLRLGRPPVSFPVTAGPTPGDLHAMRAQGIPKAFAVVTPCNPRGQVTSDAANARAVQAAALALTAAGVASWPGDGLSPDASHVEPGFVVALSRAAARALARQWEQSAFWYVDGASVWLCGALVAAPDACLTTPGLAPPPR
jgi:hypothetical protein